MGWGGAESVSAGGIKRAKKQHCTRNWALVGIAQSEAKWKRGQGEEVVYCTLFWALGTKRRFHWRQPPSFVPCWVPAEPSSARTALKAAMRMRVLPPTVVRRQCNGSRDSSPAPSIAQKWGFQAGSSLSQQQPAAMGRRSAGHNRDLM